VSAGGAVVFDPFSAEFYDDPYPMYARLRAEAPVYFNEQHGFYALSRYQDVLDASANWEVFSSSHGQTLSDLTDPNYDAGGLIISIDPPKHERLRSLVNRAFTPRAVARMEHIVRDVITSVMASLQDRDSFDVVEDFTGIFPNEIISAILGIPAADRPNIRRWTNQLLSRQEGTATLSDEAVQAYIAQAGYFLALAQEKPNIRPTDMISHLVEAEIATPDGQVSRLTDKEVADFSFVLGAAGTETVTKLVSNALVLFSRNRDQLQLVSHDRSLVPAAIEEAVRFWPPSQYQGRYTMTDITLHGVTIPKASPVLLVTGAANRDEAVYDNPDVFDVTRTNLPASLGFGRGVHYCIGAALARTEARVAIDEFLSRWPAFEVDEAGLRRVHMANVAGYSNVPVTVASAHS